MAGCRTSRFRWETFGWETFGPPMAGVGRLAAKAIDHEEQCARENTGNTDEPKVLSVLPVLSLPPFPAFVHRNSPAFMSGACQYVASPVPSRGGEPGGHSIFIVGLCRVGGDTDLWWR